MAKFRPDRRFVNRQTSQTFTPVKARGRKGVTLLRGPARATFHRTPVDGAMSALARPPPQERLSSWN
jgi:hypothetical protein